MTRSLFPSFSTVGPNRSRQRGVALMVVLILLVLMTLLALVSLRGTLLQERMSSSQYDRSLGFQATEAALREAEFTAAHTLKSDIPDAGTCDGPATGLCATPVPTDTPRWLLDDASWNAIAKPAGDADLGLTRAQHAARRGALIRQGGVGQGVEAFDAGDLFDQVGGTFDIAAPGRRGDAPGRAARHVEA